MASLFISYSRKDVEAARRLTDAFKSQDLDFWIDWEGIPPTVDWWKEIEKGIEEADIFLFLVSPDSCDSRVCYREIAHAVKNGKRLAPVVVREIQADQAPAELSHLNWTFIREQDDFQSAFKNLLTAIKTDYDWAQAHRQIQVKALEWERSGYENSFLLRGKELLDAEQKLASNSSKEPRPTDLQRDYVLKSRQAADRQRRITMGIALAGIVALAALAVFGFVQAGLARSNEGIAVANASTAQAASTLAFDNAAAAQANADQLQTQLTISRGEELAARANSEKDSRFDLALLFSLEGLHTHQNSETEGALLTVMDSHPALQRYLWQQGVVEHIAFSRDGTRLASASTTGNVMLWDVSNPAQASKLAVLSGHQAAVEGVAFSPDGNFLASGSNDQTILLWDISDPTSPKKVSTLSGHQGPVLSVVFSPGGRRLASGSDDQTVILWDVTNPASPAKLSTLTAHEGPVRTVVFSPNGTRLATGSNDKKIILWDVSDASNPSQLVTVPAHDDYVLSLAFSPDGTRLASGSRDTTVRLWDVTSLFEAGLGARAQPPLLATLTGHTDFVWSVTFSPDGTRLASASWDRTVILWDVSNSISPTRLGTMSGHDGPVLNVAFRPGCGSPGGIERCGDWLASGGRDGAIVLWNIGNPIGASQLSILRGHSDYVKSIAFSPECASPSGASAERCSKLLASSSRDKSIILWDISDPLHPSQLATLTGHEGPVLSVAFSPDGNFLASGSRDKNVFLWDVRNPANPSKVSSLSGHEDTVESVAFSPSGQLLASGSDDNNILLWDVSDPTHPSKLATLMGHSEHVGTVAFSPDGKLLASGSNDDKILLWDVSKIISTGSNDAARPAPLATLAGHLDDVYAVAFSPDGKRLASGSDDNTIILWDITDPARASKLSTLLGHDDTVRTVAFSPDGKRLASGGDDNRVILWDLTNPTNPSKLVNLTGHSALVERVAISPDGKRLASASRDKTIILWDVDTQSLMDTACAIVGRNFTREEWGQYIHSEDYHKTCPQWPLDTEVAAAP